MVSTQECLYAGHRNKSASADLPSDKLALAQKVANCARRHAESNRYLFDAIDQGNDVAWGNCGCFSFGRHKNLSSQILVPFCEEGTVSFASHGTERQRRANAGIPYHTSFCCQGLVCSPCSNVLVCPCADVQEGANGLKPKRKAGPAKHHVTERAILARINRALKKSGEVVRKSRSADAPDDYFKVLKSGSMVQYVDLKELAEELKVLKTWEVLEK
jgi:hypothetical protein